MHVKGIIFQSDLKWIMIIYKLFEHIFISLASNVVQHIGAFKIEVKK